jgi:hypothetical protein
MPKTKKAAQRSAIGNRSIQTTNDTCEKPAKEQNKTKAIAKQKRKIGTVVLREIKKF